MFGIVFVRHLFESKTVKDEEENKFLKAYKTGIRGIGIY
jgi:hypothetical protein